MESVQDSEVEHALRTVRALRPRILAYVGKYGPAAAAYFDTAIDLWYHGSLAERVSFVEACASNPALRGAWSIVHGAGALAAPLVPYIVRRYYRQRVPERHG
jgi:hypothetical protein